MTMRRKQNVLLRIQAPGEPVAEKWIRRHIVKNKDGTESIIDAMGNRQPITREGDVPVTVVSVRGFPKIPT